jgi:hypothetical protein
MCLSDGFASPTCAQFTISIEDPIKEMKKKKEAIIIGKNSINKGETIEKIKATIAITKINRDGTAILRVKSREESQKIASLINDKNLEITITTKFNEKVDFSIIA